MHMPRPCQAWSMWTYSLTAPSRLSKAAITLSVLLSSLGSLFIIYLENMPKAKVTRRSGRGRGGARGRGTTSDAPAASTSSPSIDLMQLTELLDVVGERVRQEIRQAAPMSSVAAVTPVPSQAIGEFLGVRITIDRGASGGRNWSDSGVLSGAVWSAHLDCWYTHTNTHGLPSSSLSSPYTRDFATTACSTMDDSHSDASQWGMSVTGIRACPPEDHQQGASWILR